MLKHFLRFVYNNRVQLNHLKYELKPGVNLLPDASQDTSEEGSSSVDPHLGNGRVAVFRVSFILLWVGLNHQGLEQRLGNPNRWIDGAAGVIDCA